MATNNFKSFATGASANVTSQADYEALTALLTGFQSGKASSAQINKALRQASSIAAMIGQFLNAAGLDAVDDGNISTLLANFNAALTTNLSLGTASKRNVGTGTNQIPDINSFTKSFGDNGYQKLPGGLIIQWGQSSLSDSNGLASATFPVAFPTGVMTVQMSEQSSTVTAVCKWGSYTLSTTGAQFFCQNPGATTARSGELTRYLVIGY
ncbi:gp53-like domain-containing protein [Pantoea septica]|uniref:gp53-like domain-containing protein n=1 Tax=Pantoea septica TaxID=472695 RepID=UPI0028A1DF05|nr:hypothetical protein [Pantoea septica]